MRANATSGMRLFRSRTAGWCVVRPDSRGWLDAYGLSSAADFLRLPGVVVSGHTGRNVSRVRIGSRTAYLKREHRIRVRDCFRSWRDGFGWSSMSGREAAVLRRLDEHGLPGPRWLAFGEARGEGFLLVEESAGSVDLRSAGRVSEEMARRIGQVIARLHAAGIDQPDLFGKHFLVRPGSDQLTILDWQRAVVRRAVHWSGRIRGLAALRATSPADAVDTDAWDRLLTAYLSEASESGTDAPSLPEVRTRVEALARALGRRPGIRAQQVSAERSVAQELIRIGGETVCAVPTVAAILDRPDVMTFLYDPANHGRSVFPGTAAAGVLRVGRYPSPAGRWWAAARGKAWRSRELRVARLLFHLERAGIPAPRLLAYGQSVSKWGTAGAFVLYRPLPGRRPGPDDDGAVRELLGRLHAAGVWLADRAGDGIPFGITADGATVTDPLSLRLTKRLSAGQAARGFRQLAAHVRGAA